MWVIRQSPNFTQAVLYSNKPAIKVQVDYAVYTSRIVTINKNCCKSSTPNVQSSIR
jgi:hypothetical protein